MSFDPRLMVTMASFMSLAMSIVLFAMWRSYPRTIGGLAEWSASALLWCVASLLFIARGRLPDLLSVVAATTMLFAGYLLFYQGSRHHYGAGSLARWPVLLGLVAACAATLTWFTSVRPSFPARVVFLTLTMLPLIGAHVALLLRQPRRSFGIWLMLVVLGFQALLWSVRCVRVLTGSATDHIFEASPLQMLAVGTAAVTVPLITIACVLVASDKLHRELEQMSRLDMLTRTLTRRAIMQACEEEIRRSQRQGHPLSLLMIDLDNFKAINDTHGHQHGDAILADFAARTSAQLRPCDRLGRYGGEEFLLLLPHADSTGARRVAHRIHSASSKDQALSWTVSIGLTHSRGAGDTLQAMLERADAALYRAKRQGRNQTLAA